MITPEVIAAHNLTSEEFNRIKDLLGREPNLVELGVFSVMWSEHCSYKSSRIHLKRLPTQGERVIVPPGENAGVVDIGEGWCAAFKIESHNHPSFIEPFQGAATGVGGILRDIFTMGARPIAVMDALRFGPLDKPRNRRILEGAGPAVANVDDSRVLSGPLQHALAARRQSLQMNARRLVGAMLAPHHTENAEFGDRWLAPAEQLLDFFVLIRSQAVLPDSLRRKGRGQGSGHGKSFYCRI